MNIFRTLCRRLSPAARDEAGLTLIEILVAMTIFAIISTGIALGVTASLVNVRDSQNRETAINLAAGEVDLVRAVDDIFTVNDLPQPKTVVVVGVTFRIDRKTNWVNATTASAACGADTGGTTLRYKRVNITVTWDGMRDPNIAAHADTILAPNSRINDPLKGTILVHVIGANGVGMPNVTVTAAPNPSVVGNTAAALTVTPAATDIQGCSYILKVVPGTYDVTISKSGYISSDQSLDSTSTTVGVVAGASASAGFQFDNAGRFTTKYATNAPGATIPTNLDVSYLNSYGTYVAKATTGEVKLHPFADGYTMIAGKYVDPTLPSGGCASVDPAAWPSNAVAGVTYAGSRPDVVAAAPGQAPLPAGTTALVPMGVVSISLSNGSGGFLNAVSQATAPGTGDPGCAVGMSYTFGQLITSSTAKTYTIALPYGSWKLYQDSSSTGTKNQISTSGMTPVGTTVVLSGSNVITFDPRSPVS